MSTQTNPQTWTLADQFQHPDPESAVLAGIDIMVARRTDEAHSEFMLRRSGWSKPQGTMDKQGRWFPAQAEEMPCCANIRKPSRQWPMGLYRHCCTMTHIAQAMNVPEGLLAALHRERNPAGREGGLGYFKQVAVLPDGTMVSLRDRSTVWAIGMTNTEQVRQEFGGGLFVYGDLDAAKQLGVPSRADGIMDGRAIVECRCDGSYVRYADEHVWKDGRRIGVSRVAFSQVTPVRVVAADPRAETWLSKQRVFVEDGIARK